VTDILFEISKRVKGTVQHSFALLGGNSREFVKLRTSTLIPWKDLLSMGVWVGKGYQYKKYHSLFKTPSRRFEFYSGNLKNLFLEIGIERKEDFEFLPHYKEIRFLGERKQYPLILLPYQPLMMMGNGSQNYPWAQEIFLPMQGMGWDTLVEINSETAKALNLKEGQSVWVESPFKKIRTRIKFSEGVHPEVVAIPMGQGHDSYGKWQKGIGVNPNEILGVDYDWISGQSAFYNTRVKVYPV
jgi:molybdopterin-containing oxidoreductase family iron-sulfur binding subunit